MNLRLTSSALALVAMTAPALADVTSEQVWKSWVDYYQSMGYTVTEGKRDQVGETLTVSQVEIKGGAPDSNVTLDIPAITLTGDGSGKVKTVFADKVTGVAHGTGDDAEPYQVPFTLDMPGNEIETSGAAEDMTHVFTYPQMDLTLSTIKSNAGEKPLPVKVSVADTTGKFHVVAGDSAKYDYDMKSGKISLTADVPSETDGQIKVDASIDGAETSGDMALPKGMNVEEDMNAALKAGMALSGVFKMGAVAANFDVKGANEEGEPKASNGKISSEGFDLSYKLSPEGMSYQAGSDASTFEITSSDIPFPVNYAIESGKFDMQIPVMKSDSEQPFKFAYAINGVTLGDAVWNVFDQGGQLPRDPASLELDVSGKLKVLKDLFDQTATAAVDDAEADGAQAAGAQTGDAAKAEDAPADEAQADAEAEVAAEPEPFEPVEINLNKFALHLLGAKVDADGKVTVPEGGDISAPIGNIDATAEGVNGLIDKLTAMGLIPQDQVMSIRMMLAMFAKPVAEGQDKLATKVEFKEGGALFVNGQQMR